MSVAAPTTAETKGPSSPTSLWAKSMIGGIYVLGALLVVFFAVPHLWHMGVTSTLQPNNLVDKSGRFVVQVVAAVLLAIFGLSLAGPNPQRGLRGGIFLALLTIFAAFFIVRGLLLVVERMSAKFELGQAVTLLFYLLCLWLFWKYLKSDRMTRWAVGLESAGWFDAKAYKKNQGVRVRRLTILGVLLLLGTGIYTLLHNNLIAAKDWTLQLPYTKNTLTVLPDAQLTVPLILTALAVWFAWRVVNWPVFADFLIATEAEINKVSWTPRPRLIQDTIVVLTTVFIITMFLFIVDVFWGWFLSRELINVLPSEAETRVNQEQTVNTNEY